MNAKCPACAQLVIADDQWAGTKVPCPTCNQEFTLPTAGVPPIIPVSPLPPFPANPPTLKPVSFAQPAIKTIGEIPASNNTGVMRTVQITIICIAAVVGIWIWKGSGNVVTKSTAVGTTVWENVGAIEYVLKQDTGTRGSATNIAGVVANMRAIDTSSCPRDFQLAYLAHIHAWESMAHVVQQAATFKAENESTRTFMEAFVRTLLGDPLGKIKEEKSTQSQIGMAAQAARQQIRQTFNHVEELAVKYGAKLPKKERAEATSQPPRVI